MPALFIGRFQPLHLGHLGVIKKALKGNDRLFIGIGSADENFQPFNPFTIGERFTMIEKALSEAKIPPTRYAIAPIPNIENYALWPYYVELCFPHFERIYTGSPIVKMLFENANSNRKKPWEIVDVQKELKISATQIRQSMLKGKKWQHFVPKSTARLMVEFDALNRLKKIQQ